ncbi:hypothetical protein [Streptomyces sp. NPDC058092]|uniref:hypothetical protein n=1 Tax=Streptomyces sp. NPDC058092 TaxID=3346336 RepID=UPI0036E85F69
MEQEIRNAGAGNELDELLAMPSGGAGVDAKRAKALLDAIDDACARYGLAAVTVRSYGDAQLPAGFGRPPATVEQDKWICPQGFCGRVVFSEEAPTPPACAAGGIPMAPFRLR